MDLIRRRIPVHGSLTQAQRARLGKIATKCPVHKTLMATLQIIDEMDVATDG